MANVIYNKYKEALMSASSDVSLISSNVVISLIDSNITTFSSDDEYYSDLIDPVSGITAETSLSNTSVVDGVFDADNVVFTSVSGAQSEALLLWINTGDANTSRLVAWMDTDIDGLPITPDGSNVDITWSTSGIFKL